MVKKLDSTISNDDRFPECVRFRIALKPSGDSVSLHVDLTFGEEWVDLHTRQWLVLRDDWRFQFGISGGRITIVSENLSCPVDQRNHRDPLSLTKDVKQSITHSETTGTSNKSSIGGEIGAGEKSSSAKLQGSIDRRGEESAQASKRSEFQERLFTVKEHGDDHRPVWTIRSRAKTVALQDSLKGHWR